MFSPPGSYGKVVSVNGQLLVESPRVHSFLEETSSIVSCGLEPAEACRRIRPSFAELLAADDWLPPRFQEPAPESGMGGGIGQWLLYRAGDGSLSLFALVVPAGSATPVHDHLAWGLVGLYRGTQDEEVFAREGEELRLVERRALHA